MSVTTKRFPTARPDIVRPSIFSSSRQQHEKGINLCLCLFYLSCRHDDASWWWNNYDDVISNLHFSVCFYSVARSGGTGIWRFIWAAKTFARLSTEGADKEEESTTVKPSQKRKNCVQCSDNNNST